MEIVQSIVMHLKHFVGLSKTIPGSVVLLIDVYRALRPILDG